MKKIYYFFHIVRIQNLIIASLCVVLSSYLLSFFLIKEIFICILLVVFTMSFGYIMNDIIDIKSDQINHPKRMLIQNKITLKEAKILSIIFFIFGIILSFQINYISQFIYLFIVLPLLILYNLFFKKIPFIGNIATATLLGSVFIFTELVLTKKATCLIIPSLLAFNLSFIREIIKDLHDLKGDIYCSMNTIPAILGIKRTCQYLSYYLFISCILFSLPWWLNIYSYNYLISLIFLIEIPILYSLLLLLRFQTIKTFREMTKLYKLITIAGLIVILTSKF